MPKLIYIADDEENIRSLMKTFLENEGYEVRVFADGYSIRQAVDLKMPDLIILDVMMPGDDGLKVCAGIRKISSVPIIIVSAKDSPIDRVNGLTLGSDDYMTKPFLPLELTARVKALFRRAELAKEGSREREKEPCECGNIVLDPQSRKAYIENEVISLTPTEFDFLLYLMERKGAAVSKKELLEQVWGYAAAPGDLRITDDLVKRLRKKLKIQNAAAAVETVWGYGYRVTENEIRSV